MEILTSTINNVILNEPDNIYTFNPSISHWKDTLYLCSYRMFVRYEGLNQRQIQNYDYSQDRFMDPNHPWLGGEGCSTYWKTNYGYGYDKTGICLLTIDETGIKLIKKLREINGIDARLLKITNNLFVISYNIFIDKNKSVKIKDGGDCEIGCALIGIRFIELEFNPDALELELNPDDDDDDDDDSDDDDDNDNDDDDDDDDSDDDSDDDDDDGDERHLDALELKLHPETILCPLISNQVEKNWSFYTFPVKDAFAIRFSYGLYPRHEIYSLLIHETEDNVPTLHCHHDQPLNAQPVEVLKNLKQYYGDAFFISVTTPAVRFNNDLAIGVGHIKYKYKEINLSVDNNLNKFTFLMHKEGKVFHASYVYLMFFYTFDLEAKVHGISPMFLPPSDTSLCFPSGITLMSNWNTDNPTYMISYGDSDSECKVFYMSHEQISKFTKYKQDTPPENIEFMMLKNFAAFHNTK